MKLHQILDHPSNYYLGTDLTLKGEVTRADLGPPDLSDHKARSALEKLRPEGCLPRSDSILLARDPLDLSPLGFRTSRVYAVVPLGPLQWSDHQWWEMIREATGLPVADQPFVVDWAAQYWAGAAAPTGEPLWEGRCAAVKIVSLVRQ